MSRITGWEIELWQNHEVPFTLLDVRKFAAVRENAVRLPLAQWLDPAQWLEWKDSLPKDRPIVLYCAHGQELSQGLCAALEAMQLDARYLVHGIAGWIEQQRLTEPVAQVMR